MTMTHFNVSRMVLDNNESPGVMYVLDKTLYRHHAYDL